MTDATIPATAVRHHRKARVSASPLQRVRRAGYVVLALQFIGFLAWSTDLYRSFALTYDFAQYQQAWYLIAHGQLNPYDTVHGFSFWQNHSEFLMWPLALFYWAWPHPVTLLWIQDAGVVAGEVIAFTWLCEIVQRHRPGRDGAILAGTGLALLAINPWMWWTVGWDFHTETIAIPFAVLMFRDLMNGRRRAWLWVVPLLACGDVADTYIAAAGAGAMLASRAARRQGFAVACAGAAGLLLLTITHGNLGSGNGGHAYDYLAAAGPVDAQLSLTALVKGIALHPAVMLRTLWAKKTDIWSNLAPDGVIGIAFTWMLPLTLIVLGVNMLWPGLLFTAPSFQYLPLYVLSPIATVAVLMRVARWRRWLALTLAALAVAQAVGWAAVWGPRTPGQWLLVPGPAARTLADIEARIPASAEVMASQGVVGRFADRDLVYTLFGPGSNPVAASTVWFVIAPQAGIEVQSLASAMAFIAALGRTPGATLMTHANGVWAFRWHPPAGTKAIQIPTGSGVIQAWTNPGAAGQSIVSGPTADWHAAATGKRGYVTDELEWLDQPGSYRASVTLSATGPVNFEVWNDNCNRLLARRTLTATGGTETAQMPVDATAACGAPVYSGWGPFRVEAIPPPAGQRLEIRVWSAGGETVNVYRAGLTAASGG
jgi:hypothetical protein